MLIAFFAIIYRPLNLQRPFQKSEVRDSECLVYYRGKIERVSSFCACFTERSVRLAGTWHQCFHNYLKIKQLKTHRCQVSFFYGRPGASHFVSA